jgi:hypothetical protein
MGDLKNFELTADLCSMDPETLQEILAVFPRGSPALPAIDPGLSGWEDILFLANASPQPTEKIVLLCDLIVRIGEFLSLPDIEKNAIYTHNIVELRLNTFLKQQFTPYKNLDGLEDYFQSIKHDAPLIKIVVENGKVLPYWRSGDNVHMRRNTWQRTRSGTVSDMIQEAITRHDINLPYRVVLYVNIGDKIISDKYPILNFAKASSENGILIPDWTFANAYKSQVAKTWGEQASTIGTECSEIPYSEKIDGIFFQGGDTSKGERKTNIRRNLKNLADLMPSDPKVTILIDKEPPTKATEWCKFKYLLDLPGAHPWSVRLKELLLSHSLVIKVDLPDPWVNFYSPIFEPGVDYVRVTYVMDDVDPKRDATPWARVPERAVLATYKEIVRTARGITEPEFMRITQSAFMKVNALTEDVVMGYFANVIKRYIAEFYM